eukprot:960330_1
MNIQPFLALDGNGVPAPPPPLGQIQPPPAGAAVPPPPFPGAPGGAVPIVPGIQQNVQGALPAPAAQVQQNPLAALIGAIQQYGGHPAPQQQQPHVVPPPQPHIQLAPPVIPPGQVPVAPLAGIPQAMGGFNQVPGLAALLQNQNIPPAERQAMAAVAQAIVPNMGGMGLAVPGQYVPPGRLAENEVERKAENVDNALARAYLHQFQRSPHFSEISDIVPTALYFLLHSLAQSSKGSYSVGQKKYFIFTSSRNIPPFPLSDVVLTAWAADLSKSCRPSTIRSYISSVRSFSRSFGHQIPRSFPPVLSAFLRGFSRAVPRPPRLRLPITVDILARIQPFLPPSFDGMAVWAAMCMATFGLFRIGEILPRTTSSQCFLPLGAVSLCSISGTQGISIFLAKSKADQVGKGATIFIGESGSQVCACRALVSYLSLRRSAFPSKSFFYDHIFILSDGSPLTSTGISKVLSASVSAIGLDASSYSSHSFRKGGATSMSNAGFPDHIIQQAGRWSSECFKRYVSTPAGARLSWAARMAGS